MRTVLLKLLRLIPVLLLVSFGTFLLLELVPGDPAIAVLGPDAPTEEYERVREELGLNDPLLQRYASWLGDVVTGDLGNSIARPATTVASLIMARLPVTLEIALIAIVMALVIAIPLGMFSAYRAGSRFDRAASGVTSALISIPPFVSALLLIFLFVFNQDIPRYGWLIATMAGALWIAVHTARLLAAKELEGRELLWQILGFVVVAGVGLFVFFRWPDFPRQGFSRLTDDAGVFENLRTAFLPALTIALTEIAVFARLLRSDMMSTLQEDFILSARAKGMPGRRILVRDALRPSSFSLITLAGVALGRLIGGTVIVETIFNLPGMGRLIVQDGVVAKDFTVVQGAVLVIAVIYVVLNSLVDLSYAALDPRIRRGRG